ncbi:MAG: C69 family dipeptidase [Bacteroidales bacterium]|nr:C69 family dipeptidase [Bacteroidales bacterium]
MNVNLRLRCANRWGIALIVSVLCFSFGIDVQACTNLIVGKRASVDGSVIITYSADDYGFYGYLRHYPAGKHAKGTKRKIYDGDTNEYHGEIDEAPETYRVMGNINEWQVSIGETTFEGRQELINKEGIMDYISLMSVGLQRSKTAREAIRVMVDVANTYGYNSSGESFTIADPNEVWVMEMIGKGPGQKGVVWVAVRIPDDCISAHANQSRIRKFDLKDKENVWYSKDVISFARQKGYFTGKDADFSFADAYNPLDFGALRFCEARVWSFFNRWVSGMDKYVDYVSGKNGFEGPHMPLYVKADRKLSVRDVMASMRDHYEGTPFDLNQDAGQGIGCAPYRPTPLTWQYDGKTYFNERPISTQQPGFTFVSQLRSWLPREVGGIMWFGNDDANMIAYTPVYSGATQVPECYAQATADINTFSTKSAFWVCNWVANMVYPRYNVMFPTLAEVRDALENRFFEEQGKFEAKVVEIAKTSPEKARLLVSQYTLNAAEIMMTTWNDLAIRMIVKFNDQAVREEVDGKFIYTEHGLGKRPNRVGLDEATKRTIVETTGDKFEMPTE